ncbi:12483_t:CDS:2, partial [Acaulospora colombiana]
GRPHANVTPHPAIPRVSMPDGASGIRNGTVLPPYTTIYYFDQVPSNNDTGSLGNTMKKEDPSYYRPQFSGYLTNRTIPGLIAQPNKGATVVLEHRFFGLSNPRPDLSSGSLALHTVHQAVEDLAYFAKNVHLPFPEDVEDGANVGPDKNPWILVGGSYSGALTSWAKLRYNSFRPCLMELTRSLQSSRSMKQKNALKAKFGMPNVTHYDDVAGTLRNQLWNWQSLNPTSGGAIFYDFCDALEVVDGTSPGPEGRGLEHALDAWGKYETDYVNN